MVSHKFLIIASLLVLSSCKSDIAIEGYIHHQMISIAGITKDSPFYPLIKNDSQFENSLKVIADHDLWGKDCIFIDDKPTGKKLTIFLPKRKEILLNPIIFENPHDQLEKEISYKVKIDAIHLEDDHWLAKNIISYERTNRIPSISK
ncbi:MAG: hypothetical protein NE334_09290 [Lentisphaeraceae bacterium]|nr:hypothetical protein [Lentisphaeraceae bacterium]